MQLVGDRQPPPEHPQHARVLRRGMGAAAQHVDRGDEQHGAENVDDRVNGLQQRYAGGDERGSHHKCADDADHEHPVLVARRDGECGEDSGEQDDVVDRQALLDQVPRQVGLGGTATRPGPHQAAEAQSDDDPDGAPRAGLAQRHLAGPAVQDEHVQGQHRDHEGEECGPRPYRKGQRWLASLPFTGSRLARRYAGAVGAGWRSDGDGFHLGVSHPAIGPPCRTPLLTCRTPLLKGRDGPGPARGSRAAAGTLRGGLSRRSGADPLPGTSR